MYAYWYEDGKVVAYEGTRTDFKYKDRNSYYSYGEFLTVPKYWCKVDVVNGFRQVFNIFAEDVPTDIRALHLLLVKE